MHRTTKGILTLALLVLSASACTRRVQVESEPSRSEVTVSSAATIEIAGVYDYVVPLDDGDATGTMTITRAGAGYAVAMTSNMGGVTASNVRRTGNTLNMDVSTPGGDGAVEITWQSRDRATGRVFLGEVLRMNLTRRS